MRGGAGLPLCTCGMKDPERSQFHNYSLSRFLISLIYSFVHSLVQIFTEWNQGPVALPRLGISSEQNKVPAFLLFTLESLEQVTLVSQPFRGSPSQSA